MDPDLNLDPPKGAGYFFAFYNLDPTHCKKRHQFEIFNTSDNQKVGDCPEVSWVCYIITYSVRGGRIVLNLMISDRPTLTFVNLEVVD